MNIQRLEEIHRSYRNLRIAVVGDLCLDRYFEIDPDRRETSIETGLPVHNVARVRCQPGASGTIMNNLAALQVGAIYPAAIIGEDGEGFELKRALGRVPGLRAVWIVESPNRHTFTYSKPLLMHRERAPEELSRLDIKNWSPPPPELQEKISAAVESLVREVDAVIVLDQVDVPETGVITSSVLKTLGRVAAENPDLLIVADSRRGLSGFPKLSFKMNAAELAASLGDAGPVNLSSAREHAARLSVQTGRHVFVTLSEQGMLGAWAGHVEHAPSLPLRGEIDIVGAGDCVTANLACALAAGASLKEALEIAQLAASIVVHQLGTTGAAGVEQMKELLST